MLIPYDFSIVGGPFDGAPGMAWQDDGKHPPPDVIFVGVCGKGNDCGSSSCRASARHVSFWTPDETERPRGAVSYAKQSEHVERCEEEKCIEPLHGKAVYAIGGLMDPRNFGAAAREPETVGAGPQRGVFAHEVAAAAMKRAGMWPEGRHNRGWA